MGGEIDELRSHTREALELHAWRYGDRRAKARLGPVVRRIRKRYAWKGLTMWVSEARLRIPAGNKAAALADLKARAQDYPPSVARSRTLEAALETHRLRAQTDRAGNIRGLRSCGEFRGDMDALIRAVAPHAEPGRIVMAWYDGTRERWSFRGRRVTFAQIGCY